MHYKTKKVNGYLIDKILYPLAIISPLFVLPQFYEVWFMRKTDGVSATSWFLMGIMSFLWLLHAVKHQDRMLLLNTAMMVMFNFSILLGIIIFSK